METNKEVVINLISIKNKGINYDEAWHTVIGKAAEYVGKLTKGPASIKEDENGNVVFVSQTSKPGTWTKPKMTEEGQKVYDKYAKPETSNTSSMTKANELNNRTNARVC